MEVAGELTVSTSLASYSFNKSELISSLGMVGLAGNWKALTLLSTSLADNGVGLKVLMLEMYKSDTKLALLGVTENLLEMI